MFRFLLRAANDHVLSQNSRQEDEGFVQGKLAPGKSSRARLLGLSRGQARLRRGAQHDPGGHRRRSALAAALFWTSRYRFPSCRGRIVLPAVPRVSLQRTVTIAAGGAKLCGKKQAVVECDRWEGGGQEEEEARS